MSAAAGDAVQRMGECVAAVPFGACSSCSCLKYLQREARNLAIETKHLPQTRPCLEVACLCVLVLVGTYSKDAGIMTSSDFFASSHSPKHPRTHLAHAQALNTLPSNMSTSSASRKTRRRPWQALEDDEEDEQQQQQEEEVKQRVHAQQQQQQQHRRRGHDDDVDDKEGDDDDANEVKEDREEDEEEERAEDDDGSSRPSSSSSSSSLALIRGGGSNGGGNSSDRPTKRHRPRRRFSHIKSDILSSKTLVRRAQEEARLRSSRSSATKWQRLLEGVCGGAGALGTLASVGMMARKATGKE